MLNQSIRPSFFITTLLGLALCFNAAAQKKRDYTQLVNPFIGTDGHGHTFPGASAPFGMVQLSPDTRLTGWDGCSGYHYTDSLVYGFSHTHLSGTGVGDYCDILFMPTTGLPHLRNTDYRSTFKKSNEEASPGYYKTELDKYHIKVELTATQRAGLHRYNYGSADKANIIIDLQHRDQVLNAAIEIINDHEIKGFRQSKGWAKNQYVYFYAKFSKPFKSYGIALNDVVQPNLSKAEGKNVKMYVQFDSPKEVLVKIGISSVSTDGALKNLDSEIPEFDFKQIVKKTKASWNNELAKIYVEGGGPPPPQVQQRSTNAYGYPYANAAPQPKISFPDYAHIKQVIFYTALYHCMLSPNVYNDVDGQYRGMDNKIHTAQGFNYYTVFSLWDTFRAEHPLLTLIDRKRTLDFIKTFLAMYDQGGLLPIWPLASDETYCMIGNHSIPVIVDAYAKGIRDFDTEKAFTAMKAAVNRNQFGLDLYRQNGLVTSNEDESVSKTLEYAYDDWCIAQMAKMMNKPADYETYIKRSQYWKNVYNNQSGFMQARANGCWYAPFVPTEVNKNYTEGNAWQYSFFVPHDVNGLINALGGRQSLEAKLDELFTTSSTLTGRQLVDISGLMGQYAHGNEPSHHIAYLYNFTNNPSKTQILVNRILSKQYSDKPDGLAGNEDCGQMSAWYVMSALGLYNIAPGQQQFQIGLPQFEKAILTFENGKKFTVLNAGTGISLSNVYLQGMNLNKKPYSKLYIDYKDIATGGEFEVFTGRLINQLYNDDVEKSVSAVTDSLIVPNPYFVIKPGTSPQTAMVEMGCIDTVAKIYYTTNGAAPTAASALYTKPIVVPNGTTIKALSTSRGRNSFVNSGIINGVTVAK